MATPTTQVLLDDGTNTFPHDISAYVLLVEGYSVKRGREDEQAAVTTGELSLVLKNDDGRFSPGSTTIASPSPIVLDQQIRLKETVNGTTFTRFTGRVKGWPVGWPATVGTHSTVSITATDAQARAERRILRSVVEEEILADSPAAYYTLGEAAGSTSAADSSGNQAPALTMAGTGTDVVFGTATGPGTDGLTAATFANGQILYSDEALVGTVVAGILCAFSTTTAPAGGTDAGLVRLQAQAGLASASLRITSDGHLWGEGHDSGVVVTDGAVHVAEYLYTGTNEYLILDGNTVFTTASATSGRSVSAVALGDGFAGAISHVALFATSPTTTRASAHATAASTGFAGESGTTRLTRLAGYAGIPVGTMDTSLTNVAFVDFTGTSAWAAIQEVADAELGIAYVNGSGDLTFHNRNRVVAKTTPDLTTTATYVGADAMPTQDDQRLLNYLEVTSQTTGVTQVVRDTTSESGDGTATNPGHGRYSDSKTYLVATDAEALDRGNWLIGNFADPTTRFGTLTFDLLKMSAADASAALTALELDGWVRVSSFPSQTPGGTTVDVVVEGYSEERTSTSWKLTGNVVARSLFNAWILGDSTYGVLGSTTKLYV
jgi:hypothetical protein